MKNFDLQRHIAGAYDSLLTGKRRPVIGITANYDDGRATLRDYYYKQIVDAGAVPVLLPAVADVAVIAGSLSRIDGLLLSGGGDYNPLWAEEEPSPRLHGITPERDLPELLTARMAYNRQLPVLGICRGMQTLAMALGGSVAQDIDERYPDRPQRVKHSQDATPAEATHTVVIEPETLLHRIFGTDRMAVNSLHHQAVATTGTRFRAVAVAADGVIEAMESTEHKPVIGVQWHPEWLGSDGEPLFRWLVGEAEVYRKACRLHENIITLDSHCDTPMLFPQGTDFSKRDTEALVNMHKMTEGRIDAVTMAAYLPQPGAGTPFENTPVSNGMTPDRFADNIFDKVEDIVSQHDTRLAIARNAAELASNKRAGKRSVLLAIENGLALHHDINNVAHFAQRGVTYITLCHNGDNDLCDSAKGSRTHGGVSPFGEQAILEMNRQGIMVDLSHAAESSFYHAIEISQTPIVCSHSNCRALCDHPRNLTDDQLRALARQGGVAQTTLYHGFLRQAGEADVRDFIAHLEHAVKVMGIDHVGIGTDFDGDGGVCGFADVSEALRFTCHLLHRNYSDGDIEAIWGGNWLRVMNICQTAKQQS